MALFATLLACLAMSDEPLPIVLGLPTRVVITAETPLAHTPTLDAPYTEGAIRGQRFHLAAPPVGPLTIELRAHLFDGYLVVRRAAADGSGAGELLAEDDDGWMRSHPRIVLELTAAQAAAAAAPGAGIEIVAVALDGGVGECELIARSELPPELDDAARAAAETADLRAELAAREGAFGVKDARTRASVEALAANIEDRAPEEAAALRARLLAAGSQERPLHEWTDAALMMWIRVLENEGRKRESVPYWQEDLARDEAQFGPEHPIVGHTLNNLGLALAEAGDIDAARRCHLRAQSIWEKALGPEHPDTAAALNNLAQLLKSQAKYVEARPLYERALAIREKALGPEHPDTAAALNNLAQLLKSQAKYVEARPLYERSLAIKEKVLGPEHPDTALGLNNLAELLRSQGKYEKARPLKERALAIWEKTLGPEHPDTAMGLNNLALLLQSQAKYEEARPLYERALAIKEKVLGPEHPDTAVGLSNLAVLLRSQGEYEEARPLKERALAIMEKVLGPEHPDTATCLNNLAEVLESQGKYEEARPLKERALAIMEKVLGPEHPDTATAFNNLASLLQSQGKYEEARPLKERALAIYEKVLGRKHPDTALGLSNLASLLQSQGKYEEARSLFERALAIKEMVLGQKHPDTATGLSNLAALLQSQGKDDEARPLVERALEIREKVLGPEHPDTALGLNNLAALLDSQGKYEEARPLYERALAIWELVLGPEHPRTATGLDNLAVLELDLGDLAGTMRHAEESLSRRRRYAFTESRRGTALQAMATHAGREPTVRIALTAARLIGGAAAQARLLPEVIDWKSAAQREARERRIAAKASADPELDRLLDRLNTARAALSNLFAVHEIRERSEHERNVERLRKERVALELEVNAKLADRPELQLLTLDQVGAALPAGSVLLDFLSAAPYRSAERRDGELRRAGEWQGAHLLAWVVSAGVAEPTCIDLGPTIAITAAIETLLRVAVPELAVIAAARGAAPAERPSGATTSETARSSMTVAEAGARLHELLWKPLAAHVGDATTLLLSPDGALALLPFGMVPDGDGALLLEKYRIVQLDDVDAYVRQRTATVASGAASAAAPLATTAEVPVSSSLLLAGGIDYALADAASEELSAPAPASATSASASASASARARGSFMRAWSPLAGTAAETAGIAELLDSLQQRGEADGTGAAAVTCLTAGEAVEERLKQELPRHTIAHLATHGYFLAEGHRSLVDAIAEQSIADLQHSPQLSQDKSHEPSMQQSLAGAYFPSTLCGLVCSGADQLATSPPAGRDNGLLTGEEIAGLDLSACDLAVLSACETSLGANAFGAAAGQGAMSLARAFRDAGAKTVISSLWRVQDDATRELMLDFYDRLWNKGESKLDALRNAQLAMLKKNREEPRNGGDSLPATWAAFVLTGEWE